MDRTELLRIARENIVDSPYGIRDFLGNKIIVLPTVFPPECTTPFFAVTMAKVAEDMVKRHGKCRALEMGPGSGAVILTVAKQAGVEATASDINPMAALCTEANSLWWGVPCKVYKGNLFENIPGQKFDLVFWNVPFFKDDPGGVEGMAFRAAFDPGYGYLTRFLAEVGERMSAHGELYLCVDRMMCDLDDIHARVAKAGFTASVLEENIELWGEVEFTCLILKLSRA